jgi:hypothetical protein
VKDTDVLAAAASLFNAFTFERLVPLLTLLAMFGLFVWVLFRAQQGNGFDASEFLRDDKGKLSWGRLGAFVCLATHTWVVMALTVNAKVTVQDMALYALTWSGSLVLLEALRAWKDKTP